MMRFFQEQLDGQNFSRIKSVMLSCLPLREELIPAAGPAITHSNSCLHLCATTILYVQHSFYSHLTEDQEEAQKDQVLS